MMHQASKERTKMIPAKRVLPSLALAIATLPVTSNAVEAVSAECRGVAAGVVAAMRAAGEISGTDASNVAVLAARRACTAAREELGVPQPQTSDAEAPSGNMVDVDKLSVWDILTNNREEKPGNKRLKRLRQQ